MKRLERASIVSSFFPSEIVSQKPPPVFIVMTIDAEVFPVGPVGWIVSVVAVLVMDRQEMAVLILELPAAFGADQAVYLQGLFPVV